MEQDNADSSGSAAADRARRWSYVFTALAVAIVATGVSYALWFRKSGNAFEAQYRREAEHIARQIERRYDADRRILESETFVVNAPGSDAPDAGAGAGRHEAANAEWRADPRDPQRRLPIYRSDWTSCAGDAGAFDANCIAAKAAARQKAVDTKTRANDASNELGIEPCDGLRPGTLPALREGPPAALVLVPPRDDLGKRCGVLALSKLVGNEDPDGAATDGASKLDGAVLMEETGTVVATLAEAGATAPRIVSLPDYAQTKPLAATVQRNVSIGGESYTLFFEPVDLTVLDARQQPTRLVVCGLVRTGVVARETFELGPSWFLFAWLLFGMGLLSLPLAKLWLAGPCSRFTRFDVALLVMAALGATYMIAVAGLALAASNRLARDLDAQLGRIADDIGASLKGRVAYAVRVLADFEKSLDPRESAQCLDGDDLDRPLTYQKLDFAPAPPADGVAGDDDALYKVAFCLDRTGNQRVKAFPPGAAVTPPVNAADRPYFKRALRHDLVLLDGQGLAKPAYAAIEILRSATTGKLSLFAAAPADQETHGVVAVETGVGRLKTTALPPETEFAVVDRGGRVLLHSNNRAHQGESIFYDVDAEDVLRAAMATDATSFVDVRYLGEPTRIRVAKLGFAGWTVLAFAHTHRVEAPVADMVIITSLGIAAVGALLALLLLVIRWVTAQPFRLRPDAFRSRKYARAGLASLGAAALLGGLAVVFPSMPTAIGFLGPAGFVFVILAVERYSPIAQARGWLTFSESYVLRCFGLAAVLVVAPSTVLFVGAYDYCERTVLSEEARHIAAQLSSPDCDACRAGDVAACRACPFDLGTLPASSPAASPIAPRAPSAADLGFFAYDVRWPLPYLVSRLPPGLRALTELTLPPQAPRARGAEARFERAVPELVSVHYDGWELALLVAALAGAAVAAGYVAHHSIARLLFLDASERLSTVMKIDESSGVLCVPARFEGSFIVRLFKALCRASATGDGATSCVPLGGPAGSPPRPAPARLLVVRPPPDLTTYLLRTHWRDRDTLGWCPDPPGAKVFAELVRPFKRPPSWLSERAHGGAAHLALLAPIDPVRDVPARDRDAWVDVLASFHVIEGGIAEPSVSSREPPSEAECWRRWTACDKDEQRVLSQLAIDGHPSPHPDTIPLLERVCSAGLVSARRLEIEEPHFAEFVRRVSSPEELDAWEKSDGGTAWGSLRVPLLTALTALLALLAENSPGLAAAGVIAPSFAAALPILVRILTPAQAK